MSRTREMNSEGDRSRSVRFGLRGVAVADPVDFLVDAFFFGRVAEESGRDGDADAAAGRRRMGDTNDDGHEEHRDAEVVTVRAAMRAESLHFAIVFACAPMHRIVS